MVCGKPSAKTWRCESSSVFRVSHFSKGSNRKFTCGCPRLLLHNNRAHKNEKNHSKFQQSLLRGSSDLWIFQTSKADESESKEETDWNVHKPKNKENWNSLICTRDERFDEWNTLESRLQLDRMIQISTRRLNFMDHQLWLQRVQEWGAGIFRFFLSKCRQRARQNHYLPVSGLIVPNVKWNRREI